MLDGTKRNDVHCGRAGRESSPRLLPCTRLELGDLCALSISLGACTKYAMYYEIRSVLLLTEGVLREYAHGEVLP
jgi:hypothetical protein